MLIICETKWTVYNFYKINIKWYLKTLILPYHIWIIQVLGDYFFKLFTNELTVQVIKYAFYILIYIIVD